MAQTPIPGSAVVTSMHGHGIVLLDTAAGSLYAANETGASVWRALQAHRPIDVIIAELSREYGIPGSVAIEHVTAFLHELERQGLIARSGR
jgi:hypothetical protein